MDSLRDYKFCIHSLGQPSPYAIPLPPPLPFPKASVENLGKRGSHPTSQIKNQGLARMKCELCDFSVDVLSIVSVTPGNST